ncbi:MAG: CHASE domain-containing protein, partial [Burkholderiales bacterium]|nr:CHASE domain-containing protein [Burkholderiales bacterium]
MSPSAAIHTPRPPRSVPAWTWPVTVVLAGVLVTAGAVEWARARVHADLEAHFHRLVDRLEAEVLRRLRQPVYGMMGARGMLSAYPDVGREQFAAYVASRDLPREFPGILGFGWIERVPLGESDRWLASVRRDGAPDFTVRPPPRFGTGYVIRYVEPAGANALALGFDAGSEPVRRRAIEAAIDSGRATLSGPVVLKQDPAGGVGALLLLPVYRSGTEPTTVEARRRALRGLLYAPFVLRELLHGAVEAADGRLDFELLDGTGERDDALLFDDDGHLARRAGADSTHAGRQFHLARLLHVGERTLTLQASTTDAFDAAYDQSLPRIVLVAGLLLSAAAAFVVWLPMRAKLRAEARAERLGAEVERLAMVARHTSNAVLITDRDRRITWVNDAFTRVTGWGAADAVGRTPSELLAAPGADPAPLHALEAAAADQRSLRTVIEGRRRDGSCLWSDVELQPLVDADGRVTGFMQIESDVTAAHEAAQTLALERTRLATLFGATSAGLGEWDIATDVITINERFARMLGHAPDALADLTMTRLGELTHPDDVPIVTAALREHLSGRQPTYTAEFRLRHADGRWLWVIGYGGVVARDPDGRPRILAAAHLDITARKAVERRWQLRAELSGDWFWETDANHAFVAVTRMAERGDWPTPDHLIGLRRDQVDWFDPPEGGWDAFHARLDRHEPVSRVLYLTHPETAGAPTAVGSRWLELDGRACFDDDVRFVGYQGVARDVTDRQVATIRLTESLALVDALFDALPIPVLLKGIDGRFERVNRACATMYGRTVEQLIGARIEDIVDAESAAQHVAVDAELLREPGQREYEVRQRLVDGRVVDMLLRKATLVGADGSILGIVSTAVDISVQRDAVRATVDAKEAAEAANRAKSAFLATMSHEIRTPMNGVLGMTELLSHTRVDVEQAQTIRTIHESAQSLLRILDDVLDFSKIEAGRLELERRAVELVPLVESVCDTFGPVTEARNVTLWICFDPGVPGAVVGDAVRLRQILNNLIGNAIKFSGGRRGRSGRVEVRVAVEGDRLRLAVVDDGIGMDADTRERLFTPFTQGEISTTRRFGGTGLGLAISRRLIELMGGTIDVVSAPGHGSAFTVRLPLVVAEEQPPAAPAPDLTGVDCVVVPDRGLPADDMVGWLHGYGANVRLAAGGVLERADAAALTGTVVVVRALDGPRLVAELATDDVRELLIGGDHRGPARLVSPSAALLGTQRCRRFVDAVAMVAGRASPEVVAEERQASAPEVVRAPTTAEARAQGRLVLIAEDDATNRTVVLRQLALLGYAAELAVDGRQALDLWREGIHAMLLTDLHMPNMDGYALAEAIRRDERARGVPRKPIVVLTANALKGEEVRARDAGVDDYLTKPVPLALLRAVMQRWLPATAPATPTA